MDAHTAMAEDETKDKPLKHLIEDPERIDRSRETLYPCDISGPYDPVEPIPQGVRTPVIRIRFRKIPTPYDGGCNSIEVRLRALTGLEPHLLSTDNQTSTSGCLFQSPDKGNIWLETPIHCRPFLFLWMMRSHEMEWEVVFAYGEIFWNKNPSEFWSTGYRQIQDMARNSARQNTDAFNPAFAFVSDVVKSYIANIASQAETIHKNILAVETALEAKDSLKLSEQLRQLNLISKTIAASPLEELFQFGDDAARWASKLLKSSNYNWEAQDLLFLARTQREHHPERLRTHIAELRTQIADIAAEIQQKRDEKRDEKEKERDDRRQTRYDLEDARQKLEDERYEEEKTRRGERETERRSQETERRNLEKARNTLADQQREKDQIRAKREQELLDQSIRIAKETRRDSRTMRGIAWVTVCFLPATFISSFFGMNFFTGIDVEFPNTPFNESRKGVWMFFVVALPLTVAVVLAFYAWDYVEKKNDKQRLEENTGKKTQVKSEDSDA